MSYKERIAARPTKYKNTLFRSRLEARWAAFFDLIGWEWSYEPVDFKDWVPDFKISFPCGNSQCPANHQLWAEVKPYLVLEEFSGHPVTRNDWGDRYGLDGGLCLGLDPTVARTGDFSHGEGGGAWEGPYFFCDFSKHVDNEREVLRAWSLAGNTVQWKAR